MPIVKDQSKILGKLSERLKLTATVDSLNIVNLLNEQGFCFAFSLCRGAMRLSDKLDWWQACLEEISKWDGTEESLDKKYNKEDLPGQIDEEITLGEIIDRAINYIILPYGESHKLLSDISMHSMLKPNGAFELLLEDQIMAVKENEYASGHFSHENLKILLSAPDTIESINNSICVLSNGAHTCELTCFEDDQAQVRWRFFDPNYLDGEAREFKEIDNLIDEIQRVVLGEDITVEIAHFAPRNECEETKPTMLTSFRELLDDESTAREIICDESGKGFSIILQKTLGFFSERNSKQILEKLEPDIKKIVNDLDVDKEIDMTPLMLATITGDLDVVELFHKLGSDVNRRNSHSGNTPLIAAGMHGHANVIEYLIKSCNVNVNQADQSSRTAMRWAAQTNHVDAIIKLHELGANINQIEPRLRRTLLMFAGQFDSIAAIEALVERGADIEQKDAKGRTALFYAVSEGKINAMLKLFELDSINEPDKQGKTPFMYFISAVFHGKVDAIQTKRAIQKFTELGVDITQAILGSDTTLLHAATRVGQVDVIKQIVNDHVFDINETNREGKNILLDIMFDGWLNSFISDKRVSETIHTLMDLGLDAKRFGTRLIMIAIDIGDVDMIRKLVNELDIDINQVDSMGWLPLMKALIDNSEDSVLRVLISLGADMATSSNYYLSGGSDYCADEQRVAQIRDELNEANEKLKKNIDEIEVDEVQPAEFGSPRTPDTPESSVDKSREASPTDSGSGIDFDSHAFITAGLGIDSDLHAFIAECQSTVESAETIDSKIEALEESVRTAIKETAMNLDEAMRDFDETSNTVLDIIDSIETIQQRVTDAKQVTEEDRDQLKSMQRLLEDVEAIELLDLQNLTDDIREETKIDDEHWADADGSEQEKNSLGKLLRSYIGLSFLKLEELNNNADYQMIKKNLSLALKIDPKYIDDSALTSMVRTKNDTIGKKLTSYFLQKKRENPEKKQTAYVDVNKELKFVNKAISKIIDVALSKQYQELGSKFECTINVKDNTVHLSNVDERHIKNLLDECINVRGSEDLLRVINLDSAANEDDPVRDTLLKIIADDDKFHNAFSVLDKDGEELNTHLDSSTTLSLGGR